MLPTDRLRAVRQDLHVIFAPRGETIAVWNPVMTPAMDSPNLAAMSTRHSIRRLASAAEMDEVAKKLHIAELGSILGADGPPITHGPPETQSRRLRGHEVDDRGWHRCNQGS
jgi:hypothetical protein